MRPDPRYCPNISATSSPWGEFAACPIWQRGVGLLPITIILILILTSAPHLITSPHHPSPHHPTSSPQPPHHLTSPPHLIISLHHVTTSGSSPHLIISPHHLITSPHHLLTSGGAAAGLGGRPRGAGEPADPTAPRPGQGYIRGRSSHHIKPHSVVVCMENHYRVWKRHSIMNRPPSYRQGAARGLPRRRALLLGRRASPV